MSNLRPTGVPVSFAGGDWHFLFTFSVIDELQAMHPGTSIFKMIEESGKDTLEGLLLHNTGAFPWMRTRVSDRKAKEGKGHVR